MTDRCLSLLAAALVLAASAAPAADLARVRISQFTGAEPPLLDNATAPGLFALDASIASVTLRAVNPLGESKDPNVGAGTFLPSMAPAPPAEVAGTIELTITPQAGVAIAPTAIHFTNGARFASNPSSFVLRSSQDAFATPLAVIDLATATPRDIALDDTPSTAPLVLRWTAGNDFGEAGGGEAGFSGDDIVVSTADPVTPPAGCAAAPVTSCFTAGRGGLDVKRPAKASKRNLSWTWAKGTATAADVGDPTATANYRFCLYDDGALTAAAAIPAGGTCGKKPCWRPGRHDGFVYADPSGRAAGITAVTLVPGAGKATATVRGHGAALDVALPAATSSSVVAQLVRVDAPACWTTTFTPPAVRRTAVRYSDTQQ